MTINTKSTTRPNMRYSPWNSANGISGPKERASMANYEPETPDSDVYDKHAKEIFEYVLPELANSVFEYKSAGPHGVSFITGSGDVFLWYELAPYSNDPSQIRWILEHVCQKERPVENTDRPMALETKYD